MKTDKLISKLNELFDKKSRLKKKQKAKLKELLKKLRVRQKKLELKLVSADGEEGRKELERELKIIQLQREKALQLFIGLKESKEDL